MNVLRIPVPAHLLAAVLLLVGLMTGCTAGLSAPPDSGASAAPVIQHSLGETILDRTPQRVVSLDLPWTDTLLALGVEPVGYGIDVGMPNGVAPWQQLSAASVRLGVGEEVPYEQIAALDPDLIVGTWTISDPEVYRRLSAIAPTIGALSEQQVTPWEDLVEIAGTVLGRTADARSLVTQVNQTIDQTRSELPGLEGKTFTLAQYVVGTGLVAVADEKDGSSIFFQRLGMVLLPELVTEGTKNGQARVSLSTERVDLLRADLLAFLINGGDESDLKAIPGFDQLPGTVAILDYPTIVGLNTPSTLSIPYALEKLRPYLEKAAG